jgi:hypothetical protein
VRTIVLEAVLAAAALMGTAACGGGSPAKPASSSPAPGANVDPAANGTFTGPINKAKQVGQQSDTRTSQMQQGDGTPSP